MWLLIPKELSGSGRFQGGGGLIILKQRLCAQHVKQHFGVRSMTLASWAVSLDFLYDYVLLCPGLWALVCEEVSCHLAAVTLSPMNS